MERDGGETEEMAEMAEERRRRWRRWLSRVGAAEMAERRWRRWPDGTRGYPGDGATPCRKSSGRSARLVRWTQGMDSLRLWAAPCSSCAAGGWRTVLAVRGSEVSGRVGRPRGEWASRVEQQSR